MLYMTIDGIPKCVSPMLRRAERILREVDLDLLEHLHQLPCAYPGGLDSHAARLTAAHMVGRAIGRGDCIRWVAEGEHSDALSAYEHGQLRES